MNQTVTLNQSMSELDQKFWDYFSLDDIPSEVSNMTASDGVVPVPEQGFVMGMYSALLTTGAFGNVAVFTSLVRSRRRKSRVNLLMSHLAVADMIVIFVVIPLEVGTHLKVSTDDRTCTASNAILTVKGARLGKEKDKEKLTKEIGWRTTNAWLAGNFACKVFLVLRAFGLYLSSNVLVCISLDRFFAVLYPLRLPIARKRSKMMLSFAWFIALLCSLPQSLVFRVMLHPTVPDFQQCVSFEAFSNQHQELAYNVFCLCAMYFLPLLIITVCYACIFYEISKNSREISDKCSQSDHSRIHLRRSDRRPLARARRRTLRMTVTIVTVFACCWLPYATMTLWYMLDRQSARSVSARIQDFFFIMAVSNSCMNPLVYGSYTLDFRTFLRTMRKVFCIHSDTTEMPGLSGPGTLRTKVQAMDLVHPQPVRTDRSRRCAVRFEETSFAGPSASSDPLQALSEKSLDEMTLKSSRSCEIFAMYTPKQGVN